MKNKTIKISPSLKDKGKRLDIFLSEKINYLTRSNIKKMIKSEKVIVNELPVSSQSKKISEKDLIEILFEKEINNRISPFKGKINIIYEDKDLIVINKPQGLIVHPGAGNKDKTLVNILIEKYGDKLSNIGGAVRPGIVHRLDKDTSGLLVVAKNNLSHSSLSKQFSEHTIKRKYIALIWGILRPLKGTIRTFITRSKRNRQMMTADDIKGKKAITNYNTLKVYQREDIPKISLIEFELKTGRTHQIRVHMNYKGTSLIGDKKYKKKERKFKRINKDLEKLLKTLNGQALHASVLGFVHPRNQKKLDFQVKIPTKLSKILNLLNNLDN